MNSTNPSPSPTPSPLVPQGSIAPKPTSRSARVLLIGLTVASLHVVGLGLVLLQGCGKDPVNTAAADTNTTTAPLTLPTIGDTNTEPSYYTSASNVPAAVSVAPSTPTVAAAPVASNTYAPPVMAPVSETPPPIDTSAPAGTEKEYKIVAGDNLSKIASKNKVSLSALLKSNPSIDPKKLKVGQVIKVPAPTAAPAAAPTASTAITAGRTSIATPTATGSGATSGGTYKVKAGDNLTKIAKAHGITVNQLRAANNLKTTQVTVGRTLKIPARATAAVESKSTQH